MTGAVTYAAKYSNTKSTVTPLIPCLLVKKELISANLIKISLSTPEEYEFQVAS